MKQKLLNKLWLRVGMIVAIMTTALSGTAWAETVTKTESWTFDGTDTWTSGIGKYCGLYGNKSNSTTVKNASITNFSNVNFSTVTSPSVVVKVNGLTNGGTNSYTVSLVDEDGNDIGTVVTVTSKLGNGSNSSSAKESEVTLTPVSGATGYRITVPAKGALKGTSYTLTYTESSSSLTPSDLAITDAPVALSFDLYDNASAQTVSFTSSSTGAVTVSGGTDYVTTSVSGNTITVTPVAVTPSAQTITVSQEADATYDAGSKTFTVTVADSTPFAGGDVTFNATTDMGTSPLVKNGITFACTSGVLDNGSEYRLYKNSVTTFSVSEGTITQIAFTGTSSNPASGFATQTGWTTDGNDGTWIGNASSVSFTASGAQVRATEIVVTVDMSATPDPVINADNVNIAYNDEDGEIAYTISYSVSGGSIVASETASWLEVDDVAQSTTTGTIEFICDPNSETTARSAEVTLTYTYNTNETVTKTVTVTQAAAPVVYTTIPALFAAATTTETEVYVTFNNWVVSGVSTNGKNVFVTDNNGNGFVIYSSSDQSSTYAVGDILSGTDVACGLKKYNGFAELLNVNATDLTITAGGTVVAANVAMADLAGVNTGALVSYENLTCSVDNSKYYLTDGTTTLQVFNSLYAFDELEDGKTYNITGIYEQFNSTKEILPRSAADIVEVQVQHNEYDLTVSNLENVELFVFDAADDSNSLLDGEGTVQVYDGTEVMISVSAEAGYELESLIVDGNDVTSEIVSDAYTFTMPTHAVTVTATAVASSVTPSSDATVTYDFSSTDNFLTSYPGSTHPGTGSSNAVSTFYYTNGDAFTASGTNHYFNADGYFMLGKSGATLTLPAFPFNVSKICITGTSTASTAVQQNIFVGDEEVSTETTEGAKNKTNEYEIAATQQAAGTIYTLKVTSAHNTQISKIEVFGYESVTVTNAGYATYCSENALDFTNTDIKAYVGTKNGNKLTFTSIKQVPANTGMLLVYAGGKTEDVPVIASATAVEDNCLVGVNAETTISSNDYILNKVNDGVGFYKAGSFTTLGAHKAYIPAAVGGNGVKGFTIDFEDDATGINEELRIKNEESSIYNLAGQRISKMQKGINIVNGKKILK